MESVNQTITALRAEVNRVRQGEVEFAAVDLDTGAPTRAGEYNLGDQTYRELVRRLKKDNFAHTDADLQQALLHYFADFQPQLKTSAESRQWAEDKSALSSLQTLPLSNEPRDDRKEKFDTAPKAPIKSSCRSQFDRIVFASPQQRDPSGRHPVAA